MILDMRAFGKVSAAALAVRRPRIAFRLQRRQVQREFQKERDSEAAREGQGRGSRVGIVGYHKDLRRARRGVEERDCALSVSCKT